MHIANMCRAFVFAIVLVAGEAFASCGCEAQASERCQEETLQTAAVAAQSSSQSLEFEFCADCGYGDDWGVLAVVGWILTPFIALFASRRRRRAPNRLLLLRLPRDVDGIGQPARIDLSLAA